MAKITVPSIHFLFQCSDPKKLYNYSNDMAILKTQSQTLHGIIYWSISQSYRKTHLVENTRVTNKLCCNRIPSVIVMGRKMKISSFAFLTEESFTKTLRFEVLLRKEDLKGLGRSWKIFLSREFENYWNAGSLLCVSWSLKLKLAITIRTIRVVQLRAR